MAIRGAKERLQSLFEKLSDDYVGTLEQQQLCDEYVDLTFIGENGVVRAKVRISECLNSSGIPLVRVQVLEPESQAVYVSPLPSAVIAIACR
jgi:hypothetical protein